MKPLNFEPVRLPLYLNPDMAMTLETIKFEVMKQRRKYISKTKIVRYCIEKYLDNKDVNAIQDLEEN